MVDCPASPSFLNCCSSVFRWGGKNHASRGFPKYGVNVERRTRVWEPLLSWSLSYIYTSLASKIPQQNMVEIAGSEVQDQPEQHKSLSQNKNKTQTQIPPPSWRFWKARLHWVFFFLVVLLLGFEILIRGTVWLFHRTRRRGAFLHYRRMSDSPEFGFYASPWVLLSVCMVAAAVSHNVIWSFLPPLI